MDDRNYKLELNQMYSSLGILNVPLETKCKHSNTCWKGIEHRMWNEEFEGIDEDEHCAHLYSPWIGNSYDALKLLVLGINMNNYGGYNAETMLANYSIKAIAKGKRKINFDAPGYPGTFFWHRIPAYVVAFLENANLMKPSWADDDFPSKEDVVKAFEYFAITNSIKCSPKLSEEKDKSKPTGGMWENCPPFILKEEIRVLEPNKILICGNSDNFRYFNQKVLDSPGIYKNYSLTLKGLGQIDGREIEIFVVPHPTSRGGNKVDIMYSLINSLNDKK